MNVSLPSKEQWKKILTAVLFSFLSTFLAVVTTAGGIQNTWEATVALSLSAAVSAFNAALYTLYITLFKKP
jgi:cation transport ATPase